MPETNPLNDFHGNSFLAGEEREKKSKMLETRE